MGDVVDLLEVEAGLVEYLLDEVVHVVGERALIDANERVGRLVVAQALVVRVVEEHLMCAPVERASLLLLLLLLLFVVLFVAVAVWDTTITTSIVLLRCRCL